MDGVDSPFPLYQIETAPRWGAVLIFRRSGIERAAPVRTLVQNLRAGEQILGRGRFHEIADAANLAVDAVSYRPLQTGLIFFHGEGINQLDKSS